MAAPTTLVSASGDALVGHIISVPAKACGLASEQAGQVLRYNPGTNLYEVQIGDRCKEVSLPMPVKGLNGEVVVCLDSDDSDDDFDELGDFEDVGTSKHHDYGFAHHSTVEFLRHARWTNPDVASVDDIPGMKMKKKTKKRKAKGTGPATAPKRTRADPS